MTVEEHNIHILITKLLSGEAEANEISSLKKWRNESSDHEQQFQTYQEAWELAHSSLVEVTFPDKEVVWDKIRNKIRQTVPAMYTRSSLYRTTGVVATLTLLIGFSLSFLFFSEMFVEKSEVTVKTLSGQKTEITLPDGSLVWLNGESSITYDTDFLRNNREVQITGEAFFDIVHANHLFKVNSRDIQIRVHGTAFNVRAYPESDIEISLLRGNVCVHDVESNQLLTDLTPGYKATVANHTQRIAILACDAETESLWRYGVLKIIDEPLTQVFKKMERWYGVNIWFKDKSESEHFWLTIKTESLAEVLAFINKTTPIHYSINGEEVTIEYK